MRCTTELTAHYLVANNESDAFETMYARYEDVEGDFSDYALELQSRIETDDLIEDALDFELVPFETVADALSVELFEQDASEDRANENYTVCCHQCCVEEDFDEFMMVRIAGRHYCPKCKPKDAQSDLLKKLHHDREMRLFEARRKKAQKFRAALERAMVDYPAMNWSQYNNDSRQYA